MGFYFYPRGGSAHACRSIATELGRNGIDVTLLAGSRSDIGEHGAAQDFFAGADLRPVDFTPGAPQRRSARLRRRARDGADARLL